MGDQAVSLSSLALAQGLIMSTISFNRILISRTLQFPFINRDNQISDYLIQIPSVLVRIPTVQIRIPSLQTICSAYRVIVTPTNPYPSRY